MFVFPGMKFKLVKSNSCSSRLELAGTGQMNETLSKKDEEVYEKLRNIVHRTPSPVIDTTEHEETVRDMIYRLENKKANIPSKPRIIESKCIEKINNEKNTSNLVKTFSASSNNLSTHIEEKEISINNQTVDSIETDDSKNVTVNNHITITAPSSQAPTSPAAPTKTKVVRNKNVDLAIAAMSNSKNLNNKPIKDKENLARKASTNTNSTKLTKSLSKDSLNDEKPDENGKHNNVKMTKWDSVGKLESISNVKNQNSIENSGKAISNSSVDLPSAMKTSNSASSKSTKMVNWSTVGKVDKEYIANDKRLVEGKKYDEMEFEEFEVLGEHYDSLNSNK